MRSDGAPLPDVGETAALHRMGLVLTSDLPDIAARWLATDLHDTPAVRLLAAHDPHDPWGLEELLLDCVAEANTTVPGDHRAVQSIAVDWVAAEWRRSGDTRWAVGTLAHLGETEPEFDLGLFIGLEDEWSGGWGRLESDIKSAARTELDRLGHGSAKSNDLLT